MKFYYEKARDSENSIWNIQDIIKKHGCLDLSNDLWFIPPTIMPSEKIVWVEGVIDIKHSC